jgi:Xaa-Pro aminopeptidase
MGARLDGYCSDITRTYPAFGEFTEKQKELYSILLGAQECVVKVARPGFWLTGTKDLAKNLTSFAKSYLNKNGGLDKYMPHSIGHHIGLDIHDGIFYGQLEVGNVFTIEPGIYGVPYVDEDGFQHYFSARIEDNYLVEEDGVRCLSDFIPKKPEAICKFMKDGLTLN